MSDPIFVKIRNDSGELYGSYRDYWRLVELSGFPTCELGEMNPQADATYILSPRNGNTDAHVGAQPGHRAKMILWELERPSQREHCIVPPEYNEEWVSDRHLHSLYTDPRCKYVTLGGHHQLAGLPEEPKLWDFVHTCYRYGKRDAQMADLAKRYSIADSTENPGYDRRKTLAQSRYGLALHQDTLPYIEPLRYMLFSCWRLPIVAEASQDFYPYRVAHVRDFHRTPPAELAEMASANHRTVTETMTFRSCVMGALGL